MFAANDDGGKRFGETQRRTRRAPGVGELWLLKAGTPFGLRSRNSGKFQ